MVEVLGYIPHKEAVGQMVNASLLLMAIPDSPDNKGIVTGKFFEYLAAKRPILAMGPVGGDVDLLIQRCNAGKLFFYNEIEPMSLFILKIFEQEQNGSYKSETTGAEQFTRRNLTGELANNL